MVLQIYYLQNLSIISALSRGCRICHFLWENEHFNIIVLCFHYRVQKFMKIFLNAPLES